MAASPYREACTPRERKLSKEEAKDLVKTIDFDLHTIDENDEYNLCDGLGPIVGSGTLLCQFGYAEKPLGNWQAIYTKGTRFYWLNDYYPEHLYRYPVRRAMISGNFYGNLDELVEDFKRFDNFSDYSRQNLGRFETMFIFPLLGLPFYFRSRKLQKLAMELPKEFAGYKYGKDALEQLRKEVVSSEQKTSDKRLVAQPLQYEIGPVGAKYSQSIPSDAEKADIFAKYLGVEKEVYDISSMFDDVINAKTYSVDTNEIKAAELESIISGRSETLGKKKLEKPSLGSYYQNLIPKLYGSKTFEDITNLKDKFYMNLPFELKDKNR